MKTGPITPAQIDFSGEVPAAPAFGDIYHPRAGALVQARHVFLNGNGLPERWRGRARFVVLETGFGLGNNFLATWQAWRDDAARCERLFFVSIERHPPVHADLVRAHAASPLPALAEQLQKAWPPLTANLHTLDFEGGRVQLLLAFGDVADWLPALRVQADAFFLDGFAPARNPQMWQARVIKALGRRAAPGATLATWSAAHALRDDLTSAGFAVRLAPGTGGKREITVARFAPRFAPPPLADDAAVPEASSVAIVGAGLAGAAVAAACVRLGLQATVFERHAAAAREASGNPAGLFHGIVHPDDGPHARLFRAAALQAQRSYAERLAHDPALGRVNGLLRLDQDLAAMQALLRTHALPPDYVQALDADAASALAGPRLPSPAWFYPGGGWLAPAAWVQTQLALPGVSLRTGHAVAQVRRDGRQWLLFDAAGALLMETPLLVMANAAQAERLLAPLGQSAWPLTQSRGQVTHFAGEFPLRLPVAGDGYVLPLPSGLLCGATRGPAVPVDAELHAEDGTPRAADHHHNIERLQRLTALPPPHEAAWQGRVGWRLQASDRLPIAGAVASTTQTGARQDQPRWLARERGLLVLTALGARGITLAPLLGRLVAAQATGTPWPLEQDLADAVDPARWRVRAVRQASAGAAQADQG